MQCAGCVQGLNIKIVSVLVSAMCWKFSRSQHQAYVSSGECSVLVVFKVSTSGSFQYWLVQFAGSVQGLNIKLMSVLVCAVCAGRVEGLNITLMSVLVSAVFW